MDLFTYLMAKNGNNTSVHGDLFSYLLGKGQSQTQTISGVTIYIPDAKKLVSFMMTKESTQNTSDITYSCDGTETGIYYFTYNSINYEFTMPTVTSDDVLVFNTETLKLTLNGVEISTTTGTSGTQLTFIASPNPDYPQEVKTVKGYRNLFDKDNANKVNAFIATNNDNLNISSTSKSLYISCEANTNYTITKISSARFKVASSSVLPAVNVSITRYFFSNDSATSATITTDSNANYLIITYYNSDDDTLTEQQILDSIMIVEGNQELPYVPYGNNYIAVNVSDGNTTNSYPIPLNNNEIVGIGDYKDELKVDKSGHVFINKKTGKVVLNGSESDWYYNSNSSRPFTLPMTNILLPPNNNTIPSILCNYYTVIKWNGTNTNYLLSITNSENNLRFRNVDFNNLNDFKTWLSTHNTDVYYPLETPELIDLQTTVDLSLFKGANTITNSEDGYMTIEYH